VKELTITSTAFTERGRIPARFTCDGENLSPTLSWADVPEEVVSFALIMDDPDAPAGTWVHWVIFNIPKDKKMLGEGIPKDETLADGSRQGITNFRRPGYGGPCPPPGSPHRYYFKLYALDSKLDLSSGASKSDVEKAMEGHILAKGELIGLYSR
jgi:Raf kinase inhibitor-like YbhB/YbcL family protein